MSKLSKIFKYIKYCKYLYKYESSFIHDTGFLESLYQNKPINKNGEPIPWMNYSVILFLQQRLNKSMSVFEYGLGYSSFFLAKYVGTLTSVEYDKTWLDIVNNSKEVTPNMNIVYAKVEDNYVESIQQSENEKYDLIIVDGRKRVACAKIALQFLKENGVLLLDDSSRTEYKEVFDIYNKEGYGFISFTGLKPCGYKNDQTTIFYKVGNNCFNI